MNIFDLLIIYLACGAPVGVYFYFQKRRLYSKQLWLKTILNFVFWIPFFVQIILKSRMLADFSKRSLNSKNNLNIKTDNRISFIQKKIENILSENNLKISIYDFREVFERFVGLTLAYSNNKPSAFKHEEELFRVLGFQSRKLSARCLHRRNQKHLFFHQTQAEKDFLQMIAVITDSVSDLTELRRLIVEFAGLLNNSRAQKALAEIFDAKMQRIRKIAVKDLEKDLWMPELRQPPAASHISTSLRAINKRAKLSAKD